MSRVQVIEKATATAEQRPLLNAIEKQLGMVPNFPTRHSRNQKGLSGYRYR